jgi:hypothetical protein
VTEPAGVEPPARYLDALARAAGLAGRAADPTAARPRPRSRFEPDGEPAPLDAVEDATGVGLGLGRDDGGTSEARPDTASPTRRWPGATGPVTGRAGVAGRRDGTGSSDGPGFPDGDGGRRVDGARRGAWSEDATARGPGGRPDTGRGPWDGPGSGTGGLLGYGDGEHGGGSGIDTRSGFGYGGLLGYGNAGSLDDTAPAAGAGDVNRAGATPRAGARDAAEGGPAGSTGSAGTDVDATDPGGPGRPSATAGPAGDPTLDASLDTAVRSALDAMLASEPPAIPSRAEATGDSFTGPPIVIEIGRVEVRISADPPPAAAPRPALPPTGPTLADYLDGRAGGRSA